MDRHVTVRLGETSYRLNLTLAAMERINDEFGSLMQARERVALKDFRAVCKIIAAGASLSASQEKTLKNEVFEAGIVNVAVPVHTFVIRLFDPEGKGSKGESEKGED